MEVTVIEEIANQLGMAVDSTGDFITTMLPQYAGLKTLESGMVAFGCLIVIIVCAIIFKVCYAKYMKEKAEGSKSHLFLDDDLFTYSVACGIPAAVALVMLLIFMYKALGWLFFPEAMLIDMVLMEIG